MSNAPRSSKKRAGRKAAEKIGAYYKCSSCRYTSDRYYNVIRHEFRIHAASSKQRRCCGMDFSTKGDYYLHCEQHHPASRGANLVSRKKHKNFPSFIDSPDDSSLSSCEPSEKKFRRNPYMLRSRSKASAISLNDDRYDSDFSEISTEPEDSSETSSDDPSEDPPTGSVESSSRESSGYETKSSIIDENQNDDFERSKISINESIDTTSDVSLMKNNNNNNNNNEEKSNDRMENNSIIDSQDCNCSLISSKNIDLSFENDGKIDVKEEIIDSSTPNVKSMEKSFFNEAKLPETFYLPIKKRILRDIEINNGGKNCCANQSKKSIVDRSNRRIKDDKEKRENNDRVVVSVDPRISWHDFTRLHREYFEGLLSNRSMFDRFRVNFE